MGERITILYRLSRDPEYPFSEAIGVLERVDFDGILRIRKRDGTLASVAHSSILKLKFIPPKNMT